MCNAKTECRAHKLAKFLNQASNEAKTVIDDYNKVRPQDGRDYNQPCFYTLMASRLLKKIDVSFKD